MEGVGVKLPFEEKSSWGPDPSPARSPSDCASRKDCMVRSSALAARSTGRKGSVWWIIDALKGAGCSGFRMAIEDLWERAGLDEDLEDILRGDTCDGFESRR